MSRVSMRFAAAGTAAAAMMAAAVALAASPNARGLRAGAQGTQTPADAVLVAQSSPWPIPAPAPASWTAATIASRAATLFYPASWRALAGDAGTVTAALLDAEGAYHGYLNVTPRQGAERLQGWAAFRIGRNRGEGDRRVHEIGSAQDVAFSGARGSCVMDTYLSRVGSHPYRELACLVKGPRATSVFVGATLARDWSTLGPLIERAAGAFEER
ncbi:MAG TPA: hypothetical protein VKG82_10495 [Solirubrobacteraceae bacterium]|nr:hypothetical protein [Solirubrobacteraceae bacterium]